MATKNTQHRAAALKAVPAFTPWLCSSQEADDGQRSVHRRNATWALPSSRRLRAAGFDDAEEIGRGGFGVVYRCTQVGLDRTVAVKVLTAELDEENRARFFREQRAMGRLTGHPNIVNVLQVGDTDSGHPYIVMPYHPQGSLDARIRRPRPAAAG